MNTKEERMLSGNLWKNIILFSVPLMLSNLLQVLFNISDLAVVGKFSGSIALGAVGSTTMLVSLYTGLLLGLGNGVNVYVARFLGSGEDDKVKRTVHTGFWLSLVFGLVLCAISISTSWPVLKLLNTKDELINDANLYLMIYFIGLPGLAIYNYGNGVLSANGDTKRPLIFLTIAGIINLGLNFLFVCAFGMGVEGVAIASAISQYISAILILFVILREKGKIRLVMKMKSDWESARDILGVGIPSGIQYGIFAVANMFIQTGINSFDHVTVEGISASVNADSFIYEPMYAFYTACASFISKNFGAGNKKRMLETYGICMLYSFTFGFIVGAILFFFGDTFLGLFTNDKEVVEQGMLRLKVMGFSYGISAFMDCTTAASRGLGKTFIPTIMVILGSCVFRIIWLYTVFQVYHTVEVLYLVYVFSWVITATAEIIYFVIIYKKSVKRLNLNSYTASEN